MPTTAKPGFTCPRGAECRLVDQHIFRALGINAAAPLWAAANVYNHIDHGLLRTECKSFEHGKVTETVQHREQSRAYCWQKEEGAS